MFLLLIYYKNIYTNNSADDFMLLINKMFDNFINETDGFPFLSEGDEESEKLVWAYLPEENTLCCSNG